MKKKISRNIKDREEKAVLLDYEAKLQAAVHKMNEASIQLLGKIDVNSEADIIVRGADYPGTYIEICHISYIVPYKISKVRIRLDKRKGKIVVDRIGNSEIRGNLSEYYINN